MTASTLKVESLTGIYSPRFHGEAVRNFFNDAVEEFGWVNPNDPASGFLMEKLPWARRGFMLIHTGTLLMFLHEKNRNLTDPADPRFHSASAKMRTHFGGEVPALNFQWKEGDRKIPMDVALHEGLVTKPLNTFEAITAVKEEFDPDRFPLYVFGMTLGLNRYPPESGSDAILRDPEIQAAMIAEHKIVNEAFTLQKALSRDQSALPMETE